MGKKEDQLFHSVVASPVMESFFKRNLSRIYPHYQLTSFKLEDQNPYLFKKSIRYILCLVNPSGRKKRVIIRGNVSNIHQPWKNRASDQALQYLYSHGFDRGNYRVPKPLGYYQEKKLQLYEERPGETLTNLITKKKQIKNKTIILISNWLARLHQLKARIGRLKTIQKVKEEINYFVLDFQHYFPCVYKDVNNILLEFLKRFKKIYQPNQYYLVHGDFNLNNIVLDKDKVIVIDFGSAWRFDSFYDLANYLTHLDLLVWKNILSLKLSQKLGSMFLQNYLRKTDQNNKRTIALINFWKVWWLIQTSAYRVSLLSNAKENKKTIKEIVGKYTIPEAKRILGI